MISHRVNIASSRLPAPVMADVRTIWRYLSLRPRFEPGCVVFCFGSAHLGVARRAASLYRGGTAPWVLVTGGSRGRVAPHATEADAYTATLRACGVPRERIVIEPHAMHTGENVALGMRALRERQIDVSRAVLVAWPTSLRRCVATFGRQFPRVTTDPHRAFDSFGPYAATPVRAASSVLEELRRLREYPGLGYTIGEAIPEAIVDAEHRLRATIPLSVR